METTANPNALQQIGNLSQMHFVRQLVLMGGLAGSIALGVAIVLWSQTPDYKLLYAGLSAQDGARVSTSLDQAGLDYRIDQRSGDILVPASEVHSTRLLLARNGLPNKATKGFSILDQKPTMGTSNFIEQARFNRALQEELVQTIEAMDSVREARVHLSIPRQTSFLRSRVQSSASVMLNLHPGTTMTEAQIAGIKHLVSASTAGLSTNQVSVLDQTGSLLSMDEDSDFSISNANLRLKRQLEEDYAQRVVQILTPIVGADRVHAQVSADLDFTRMETTEEKYDPATVLRSEQSDEEETNQETEPVGIPGLLPNDPNADIGNDPATPETTTVRSKTRTTRNFEMDRSISHISRTPGTVSRISVAVLIDHPDSGSTAAATDANATAGDPATAGGTAATDTVKTLDPAQYERIVDLVKQTIGFSEARGDSVSVIDSDFFQQEAIAEFISEESLLDNPLLWTALKNSAAGLVVLFLIFGVLRPVLKSSVANESTLPMRQPGGQLAYAGADAQQAALGDDRVSLSAPMAPGLPQASAIANYEQNLAQARSIVESEPARAAKLIQGWVADD
ncbi:MAG: flagellar basal-body MS-ring/collar protein FliF [Halieaceae bacterium]